MVCLAVPQSIFESVSNVDWEGGSVLNASFY